MSLCSPIVAAEMPAGGIEVVVRNKTMIFPKVTLVDLRQGVGAYDAGALIQVAFPSPLFTADEREFLMSGTTPEEWEAMCARAEAADAEYYNEE
jgi:hypothetical protein